MSRASFELHQTIPDAVILENDQYVPRKGMTPRSERRYRLIANKLNTAYKGWSDAIKFYNIK